MGKIFASHISDKGLGSKVYFLKPLQLNNKKPNNHIKKMGKGIKWIFLQRYTNSEKAH